METGDRSVTRRIVAKILMLGRGRNADDHTVEYDFNSGINDNAHGGSLGCREEWLTRPVVCVQQNPYCLSEVRSISETVPERDDGCVRRAE